MRRLKKNRMGRGQHTDKHPDIATLWKDRPKGRFFENLPMKLVYVRFLHCSVFLKYKCKPFSTTSWTSIQLFKPLLRRKKQKKLWDGLKISYYCCSSRCNKSLLVQPLDQWFLYQWYIKKLFFFSKFTFFGWSPLII